MGTKSHLTASSSRLLSHSSFLEADFLRYCTNMGLILAPILTTQTLTVKPGHSLISQWDPNIFFLFFFPPMRRVVWVCIKAAHLGCSTRVFRFGRQRAKKIIKHSFQFISHTRAPFYWLGPSYRALPGAGAATGIFLLYLLLGSGCIWCNITLLKYWIYIYFFFYFWPLLHETVSR